MSLDRRARHQPGPVPVPRRSRPRPRWMARTRLPVLPAGEVREIMRPVADPRTAPTGGACATASTATTTSSSPPDAVAGAARQPFDARRKRPILPAPGQSPYPDLPRFSRREATGRADRFRPRDARRNPAAAGCRWARPARSSGSTRTRCGAGRTTAEVQAFTTPGGHRRFERRALERLAATRRGGRPSAAGHPRRNPGPGDARVSAATTARAGAPLGSTRPMTAMRSGRTAGGSSRRCSRTSMPTGRSRRRAAAEAEPRPVVDDLATRLAASGVDLTDAVAQFVAARRPFLAELAALGRRRSLDPAHLGALYEDASACSIDSCSASSLPIAPEAA